MIQDSVRHEVRASKRSLRKLLDGPKSRGSNLRAEYLLDLDSVQNIRTVIDVGANSGDLILALGNSLTKYIGIEPIAEDFSCLEENAQRKSSQEGGGSYTTLQLAMGAKKGITNIFVSAAEADSSIIEPFGGFTETRRVQVETVDFIATKFLDLSSGEPVDLLKVEAEGYEPEILNGSKKILRMVRYVALDGGAERGPNQESTIEECANFLHRAGFELIKVNLYARPGVALFRNSRYP